MTTFFPFESEDTDNEQLETVSNCFDKSRQSPTAKVLFSGKC